MDSTRPLNARDTSTETLKFKRDANADKTMKIVIGRFKKNGFSRVFKVINFEVVIKCSLKAPVIFEALEECIVRKRFMKKHGAIVCDEVTMNVKLGQA